MHNIDNCLHTVCCAQVLHKRAAAIVLECTIAAEAEHRQRREASGIWPAEEARGTDETLSQKPRATEQ